MTERFQTRLRNKNAEKYTNTEKSTKPEVKTNEQQHHAQDCEIYRGKAYNYYASVRCARYIQRAFNKQGPRE